MMPVIADYTFKMFLTSYTLQVGCLKRRGALGNLPHYSTTQRAWDRVH